MTSTETRREHLLWELSESLRMASALGVLHSHLIADRVGIHSSDMECLDILHLRGSLSAGQIAEMTGLTTGAVTGLVDRLERAGYVRRAKDPNDRRRVIVELVPGVAEQELSPYFMHLQHEMDGVMGEFTDDQIETVVTFTTAAAGAMQRTIEKLRRELPSAEE